MTIVFIIVIVLFLLFGLTAFYGAPYVPSQRRFIERAFTKLYALGPNDVLLDVGSGDGKVLRAAASKGARAIGYEINPLLVLLSWLLTRTNRRASVKLADMWHTPFPADLTVVYVFAVSRDMKRLGRLLQRQTDQLGRSLTVLTYGSRLPAFAPTAELDAYHRYELQPTLQPAAKSV